MTSNGVSQHPVVCGLTTLPSRIGSMEKCLDSLLSGDLVPDMIFVSIPRYSPAEGCFYQLPAFLRDDRFGGRVVVNFIDRDWGPGTKLLGILPFVAGSKSYVVLADDDMKYRPYFLRSLIEHQAKDHDSAFSFYVFNNNGLPTGQGADGFSIWSPHLSGALEFFREHVLNTDLFFQDDVWISFWLMLKGVKITSLQPTLPHGEFVWEKLHQVNQLYYKQGNLARERLNNQVFRLFQSVDVSRHLAKLVLNLSGEHKCICGSDREYRDCHGR